MIQIIKNLFSPQKDITQETEKPQPLQVVNIYDKKGVVIKTIKDVYVVHWDRNIYHINDENNKHLMRLDIANSMMLVTHNVEDSDSNGECKYFS